MGTSVGARALKTYESVIVVLMQVLLVIVVALGTVHLFRILFARSRATWGEIHTPADLFPLAQHAFGGVLVVILGLELIETLKTYFREHRVRLEIILIVSIIALGRHVIMVDFEHMSGGQLAGIGALMFSLTAGYFLIARSHGTGTGENTGQD